MCRICHLPRILRNSAVPFWLEVKCWTPVWSSQSEQNDGDLRKKNDMGQIEGKIFLFCFSNKQEALQVNFSCIISGSNIILNHSLLPILQCHGQNRFIAAHGLRNLNAATAVGFWSCVFYSPEITWPRMPPSHGLPVRGAFEWHLRAVWTLLLFSMLAQAKQLDGRLDDPLF